MRMWTVAAVIALACLPLRAQESDQPKSPPPSTVDRIQAEADRLRPLVETDVARRMLGATADLPRIAEARIVWYNRATREALTAEQAAGRTPDQLQGFEQRELGEAFYYDTAYGTPLAYVRAIDLAAQHGFQADGGRVLDFGFGGAGHLRLLASLGAHVVGTEVFELLRAFYRPEDTGAIARAAVAGEGAGGSIELLYGQWPAEDEITAAVAEGGPYHLILSKNTLKRGYIHPEREVDPRFLVHLGVDDATFARALHDTLAPGGLVVIYNLYPAQNPPQEQYLPWATGACPFERELLEQSGLEIVAWNIDDTEFARTMAMQLGWAERMDLESDLFAMYTILRRQ